MLSCVVTIWGPGSLSLMDTALAGIKVGISQVIMIIRIFHECEVLIDKSVLRVTVWHHEALPSDAKLYPRDRFLDQYLTIMIDSFSCTPMGIDT